MNNSIQMVVFRAEEGNYAVNIDRVERIIGYSKITAIPETSDYVLGMINYQDSILPIVDLSRRFYPGGTHHGKECKILVIALDGYKVGLLVDSVEEIASIDEERIETPSSVIEGISPEYITGLIKDGEDIIIYLNVDKIFQNEKEAELINIQEG